MRHECLALGTEIAVDAQVEECHLEREICVKSSLTPTDKSGCIKTPTVALMFFMSLV